MIDKNALVCELTKDLVRQLEEDLKGRLEEHHELDDIPFSQPMLLMSITVIGLLYKSITEEELPADVIKRLLDVHQNALHRAVDTVFTQSIESKPTDQE